MQNYNKNDLAILVKLYKEGCITDFKSYTLDKICELGGSNPISMSKAQKVITQFVKDGYVSSGMKQGHKNSYYVTELGEQIIIDLLGIGRICE